MKIPFGLLLVCGNALAVVEAQPVPMGSLELDAVTAGESSVAVAASGTNSAQSAATSASTVSGENTTSNGSGVALADGVVVQQIHASGLAPLNAAASDHYWMLFGLGVPGLQANPAIPVN